MKGENKGEWKRKEGINMYRVIDIDEREVIGYYNKSELAHFTGKQYKIFPIDEPSENWIGLVDYLFI